MRRSAVLLATLAAALAVPGSASAVTTPKVTTRSCFIEVTNGSADCVVVLVPNPNGEVGEITWSGWGYVGISCASGFSWASAGYYGSDYAPFPHGADVCTMNVQAVDGTAEGYIV